MALFPEIKSKKHTVSAQTFSERVVKLALSIPPGRVSTYGAIAKAAGGGGMASRSVTGILGKAWNKGEKKIPWRRIVYSNGKIWVSDEHRKARPALYKKESIQIDKHDRIVDFVDKLLEF